MNSLSGKVYVVTFVTLDSFAFISRLTGVSREAKKKQQARARQDHAATTVSNLHVRQL